MTYQSKIFVNCTQKLHKAGSVKSRVLQGATAAFCGDTPRLTEHPVLAGARAQPGPGPALPPPLGTEPSGHHWAEPWRHSPL